MIRPLPEEVNPHTLEKGESYLNNKKIRDYAKEKKVFLWEIADKLNICDGNLSRKLRKQLSEEDVLKIMIFIDEIAEEKAR